jgi:RND superfamily putative drug exporter
MNTTLVDRSPEAHPGRRPGRPPAESGLGRLAGWSHDRRRLVLLLWIALVVLATVVAQVAGTHFQNKFSAGNTPSQRAQDILTSRFPAEAGDQAQIVFSTSGRVTDPAVQADLTAVLARVADLPHVTSVAVPYGPAGAHQVAPGGHIAYATVQFDRQADTLPKAAVQRVINTADGAARPGVAVALGGAPISAVVSANPGGPAEGAGILAAMLIMLIAFGSVVAMGLPILTALFGLGVGLALLELLTHVLVVPIFSPEMAGMIALGVGIDYALFIVTRYRQGLAEGRDPREAAVVSLATSGRSVLFAGSTVVISLLGLFLVGQPYMIGLSTACIAAVLMVLAAALTLLPAMLGFSGRAIDRLKAPGLRLHTGGRPTGGFWYRWSRVVQRRAWLTGLAAALLLVLLAVPMFSMRLAFTDAGNDPTTLTTRQAYDQLAEGFGPGFNGPLVVAVETPGPGSTPALDHLAAALRATPGVAQVVPPRTNPSGTAAVVVAVPTTSPQSAATQDLVRHLRDTVIPRAVAGTGLVAQVGGETAAGIDASTFLSGRLFLVIGAVILLSVLLLMAVFRSVAIPLKAAVMNLLSVSAAYGVMVAVFQWGWAGSVVGIGHTGPIDPWIPLTMFTILFGLSMDYEVFLLSRIREEWRRTGDNSAAVADGLAVTGRIITAAAAIMFFVFASFVVGDPLHILKVFGLGLAVAVLLDATVVRMVLVPSIMEILGRGNWWMPRWLDRAVPHLGVEVDPEPYAAPHG